MTRFHRLNPPATEEDIEAFQRLVGPLPGDYLDWMRQHNGGLLPRPGLSYEVDCRHQLSQAPAVDVIHTLELAQRLTRGQGWGPSGTRQSQRPVGFVDVASNSGPMHYLIDLRPVTYGSVWMWDQDRAAMPEMGQDPLTWWDNLTRVADSFTDFLNRLVLTRWDPDRQTFIPVEEAE